MSFSQNILSHAELLTVTEDVPAEEVVQHSPILMQAVLFIYFGCAIFSIYLYFSDVKSHALQTKKKILAQTSKRGVEVSPVHFDLRYSMIRGGILYGLVMAHSRGTF